MPTPDAPPPPRPDPIAGLEAIDCRMTAAVAAADWPRFRSLLDEMLTLVDDLGAPAPAPPTASPRRRRRPQFRRRIPRKRGSSSGAPW